MRQLKFLSLFLLLFIAGCSKKEDRWTFAVVPKLLDNPVFQVAREGAMAAAKDFGEGKIEIQWIGPVTSDAAQQAQIIESLIEKKVDGIAVSVNDEDALKDVIDKAMNAGIPVVTFDSDAPKSKRISFYGTNNYGSGRIMGELLVKYMGNAGKVALLTGTPGAPNLEERINGFKDYIKDYPRIKIADVQACYDDINKGVSQMEAVMQAHPDLNGWILIGGWPLFTPPPGAFGGKKPGKLIVISFDTLPEELEYVRQGYVQALIGQKLFGWGYESVRILKGIKEGQSFDSVIDSGVDVITKENVEEYAEKWKTRKF
jgi:ribose transport system substrate-binding protein